ncbi:hypothetical protein Vretifemale_19493 [Volvox reticuliferus]|uniref:Uncharacterized protein n=1 Tax=Volvox reticuliferus TaxID=1737510 RepID=A0A8J4D2Z5_9CHLO|nr:hypothetical protein Vretifemale_19493 [Volvox reticuliferus]
METVEERFWIDAQVICSALSKDGKKAIAVSRPRQSSNNCALVFLWDIENEEEEEQLLQGSNNTTGQLDVWDISWPAKLVAAANEDGSLCVWDVAAAGHLRDKTMQERRHMRYKTKFNDGARSCCRFSPCGQFILVGGRNVGELVLLESKYGQELLRAYAPAQGNITTMTATGCFFRMPSSSSSSGDQVVPVTADGGSHERPRREDDYSGFQQRYIQFTREGLVKEPPKPLGTSLPITFPTRFGAWYSDGSIRIFDMEGVSYTESRQLDMEDQHNKKVEDIIDIDVSGDCKLLFVILKKEEEDSVSELRVYDIDSGKVIWQLRMKCPFARKLQHVISSGDSRLVSDDSSRHAEPWQMQGNVIWSDGNGHVHLYDLSKREEVRVINTREHHSSIYFVYPQVNREFDQMLTTLENGRDAWVCLWDLNKGELIRTYDKIQMRGIFGAWFTANGLHCVSVSKDKTAALFQLDTGKVIRRFVGHEDYVTFAALSPNDEDNSILATASRDETVRIWNVGTAEQLHVIRYGRQISRIHFLQSSRWIITTDENGYVIGFDTTGTSFLPLLIFQGDALKNCKIMKTSMSGAIGLLLVTIQHVFYSSPRIINLLHLHTLSIRQPLPQKGGSVS